MGNFLKRRKKRRKEVAAATPAAKSPGKVVKLDTALKAKLQERHDETMLKAVRILSALTYSERAMRLDGFKAATEIVSSSVDFKMEVSDTLGDIVADSTAGIRSKIMQLLERCWKNVCEKVKVAPWIQDACKVLGMGIGKILTWARRLLLSNTVLDQLVPFYGKVKDIITEAIACVSTYKKATLIEDMQSARPELAKGYPAAAMDSFIRYATVVTAKNTAKHVYTFAKSIGGILADAFSFGAASGILFGAKILEIIAGFVNALVQAKMFDAASARLKKYRVWRDLPSLETFRSILQSSPIMGCVFFAMAPDIGLFEVTHLLSPPNDELTSHMLTSAMAKVQKAVAAAETFLESAAFELEWRDPEFSTQLEGKRGPTLKKFL